MLVLDVNLTGESSSKIGESPEFRLSILCPPRTRALMISEVWRGKVRDSDRGHAHICSRLHNVEPGSQRR